MPLNQANCFYQSLQTIIMEINSIEVCLMIMHNLSLNPNPNKTKSLFSPIGDE